MLIRQGSTQCVVKSWTATSHVKRIGTFSSHRTCLWKNNMVNTYVNTFYAALGIYIDYWCTCNIKIYKIEPQLTNVGTKRHYVVRAGWSIRGFGRWIVWILNVGTVVGDRWTTRWNSANSVMIWKYPLHRLHTYTFLNASTKSSRSY